MSQLLGKYSFKWWILRDIRIRTAMGKQSSSAQWLLASKLKISISELHFFLNITTVIVKIIIEKRINHFISDGKSSTNHTNNITLLSFVTSSPYPETPLTAHSHWKLNVEIKTMKISKHSGYLPLADQKRGYRSCTGQGRWLQCAGLSACQCCWRRESRRILGSHVFGK